jgi:hypothetical protein
LHRAYKYKRNNKLNVFKMKTEVTKTGFANLPTEKKELAGKAQMLNRGKYMESKLIAGTSSLR